MFLCNTALERTNWKAIQCNTMGYNYCLNVDAFQGGLLATYTPSEIQGMAENNLGNPVIEENSVVSIWVSSCQSRLSVPPAGEGIFAQTLIFICLSCLFWYSVDNLHRMTDTSKCWRVSAVKWDDDWLYYHFKCPVLLCWVLWFCSSLTCHAWLTSSHCRLVMVQVALSPPFSMTTAVSSYYSNNLLSFPFSSRTLILKFFNLSLKPTFL